MANTIIINPASGDSYATIYSGTDANSSALSTVDKGTILKVVGSTNKFYEIEYDKLLKDTDINFYPKKSIKKISIKLNKENNTSEITLDNIIKKSKINFGLNTSKEIFKLIKDYYL